MPKYQKSNNEELVKEKQSYLYNRAVGYVAIRARTEKEIRDYLLKKSEFFPNIIFEKQIDEIVFSLKEEGVINDQKFVEWWVESRGYFRPKSKIVLTQELRKKGIPKDLIDEYFAENKVNEVALAKDVIRKKAFRFASLPKKDRFTKTIQYLTRVGFSYHTAKTAFEETQE